MKNRLQIAHHDALFATREQATQYIHDQAVINRPSLYAEPLVVKYGTEDDINVILAIGANGDGETQAFTNQYFTIDTAKLEDDIAALQTSVSGDSATIGKIQEALDKVIAGAGLDEDGGYVPVSGDSVLSGATSLSDADTKLSKAVQALQKAIVFKTTDTDTIKLTSTQGADGIALSAEALVPERVVTDTEIIPNVLQVTDDGLFVDVRLDYDEETGHLSFTNGLEEQDIALPLDTHVVSGTFDEETEDIVLTLNRNITVTQGSATTETNEIRIPMSDLANELETGREPDSPVILTLQRNVDGKSVLYGTVEIHPSDNNILQLHGDALYVKGTADNIKYDDSTTVKDKIDAITIAPQNTNTVSLTLDGTQLSADVNLSQDGAGNIIVKHAGGLYANVDLSYEPTSGVLTFTNGIGSGKTFNLTQESFLKSGYYDSSTEELVLVFATNGGASENTVRIPVANLITEWTVERTPGSPLILSKSSHSTAGPDTLTGDISIATAGDNILVNSAGNLYVKGTADNIKFDESTTVYQKLVTNTSDIAANKQAITDETNRATTEEQRLATLISTSASGTTSAITAAVEAEKTRAEAAEAQLANDIQAETQRATAAEAANKALIDTNTEKITANSAAISANTAQISAHTTSIQANTAAVEKVASDLEKTYEHVTSAYTAAIQAETQRATAAEAANKTLIDTVSGSVASLNTRVTANHNGVTANTAAIQAEVVRAEAAEAANAQAISTNKESIATLQTQVAELGTNITNESARAMAAEQANAKAIATETTRAQGEEKRIEGIATANGVLVSAATNDIRALENRVTTTTAELSAYTTSAITIAANDATTKADNAVTKAVKQANEHTDTTAATLRNEIATAQNNAQGYADTQDNVVKSELNAGLSALSAKTLNATGDNAVTLTGGKDGSGNFTLTGEVRLSAGQNNIISKVGDGLLANVDLAYANGQLTLSANNGFSKTVDIAINGLIENVQRVGNALVFTFKKEDGSTEQITIDLTDLISDWEPLNNYVVDGKQISVDLVKLAPTSGNPLSQLYANVKIYDGDGHTVIDSPTHNILAKETATGRLFVEGTSSNIMHDGSTLDTVITEVTNNITNITSSATQAIDRTIVSGSYDKGEASLTLNRQDGTAIVIPGIETDAASVTAGTVTNAGTTLTLTNSDGSQVTIDLSPVIQAAAAQGGHEYTGVSTDSCVVTVDNTQHTISVEVATIDCGEY